MKPFAYSSGAEVRQGDRITYHCCPGVVEFIVIGAPVDPALAWYARAFPGGGVMIDAMGFGSVFLAGSELDDQLELVSRRDHGAV